MREIEDVFYITHLPNNQRHIDLNIDEAIDYFDKNDGFILVSKTKELFPKYKFVKEKEYKTNKFTYWFCFN